METLNIGCGYDQWGDVRLDINKKYHGRKVNLNIRADAQVLPFRNKSFMKLRASHILEHLVNWEKALEEWCRVTRDQIEIEIPTDPGFVNRYTYLELFRPGTLWLHHLLLLPKRRREHLWKFTPEVVATCLQKHQFRTRIRVRKLPLFGFLTYRKIARFLPVKVLNEKTQVGYTYGIRGFR